MRNEYLPPFILEGKRDHGNPVIQYLLEASEGRNSMESDDGGVDLVVGEGGAAVARTAGSLKEMHKNHITVKNFKRLIGISAGSVNAAYFAAGQPELAEEFFKAIISHRFFKPNIFHLNRTLDMNILYEIMEKEIPLDEDALRNSNVPVFVGISNENGEGRYVDITHESVDIKSVLQASCNVLGLTSNGIKVEGLPGSWWDGGTNFPWPPEDAISMGARRVLAFLSKHPKSKQAPPIAVGAYNKTILHNYPPPVHFATVRRYDRLRKLQRDQEIEIAHDGPVDLAIITAKNPTNFLAFNERTMNKLAEEGALQVREVFGFSI